MSGLQIPTKTNERQGSIIDSLKTLSLDNIPHNVRRNLTQVDPRLPKEIKNIIMLLKEEKNILGSLQNISEERREASKHLRAWGKEGGEDLEDITDGLANILTKVSDIEQVLTEKYGHYRNIFKEIRTAEESLISSKERKRKIQEEIQRIQKSHPKSPRIPELETDLVHVNKESASNEAEVGNTIRKKLKEALRIYLESMFESSEKIAIISGFGWDLVDLIDNTPYKLNSERPKYEGGEITQQIIKDCQVSLLRWQPSSTDIRPLLPALTNTAPAALAAQKQEYETKLSQVTASMNSLRDEHASQVQDFASKLEDQKKSYETQVNDFIAALENQKKGYEAQLNDLSAALSEERQASEQKINEASAALTAHKEQYNAQISKMKSDFETERQISENKINEISTLLDAQRQQYEAQLKEYNSLIKTKQEYEVALKERDSIISKLQSDVSSVATEKGKLSQLVKDLEETLKSKSTVDQKEDKVGKLEDEIASIKNQLSGLKFTSSVNTTQLSDPGRRSLPTEDTEEIHQHTPDPNLSSGSMMHPSFQQQQQQQQQPVYNMYSPYGGGFQPQSRPPFAQYQQQSFYNSGQVPQQPPYGYQQPPPPQQIYAQPQQPQQSSSFVGGFWNPDDDAPPAYDGPKEGYNDDKKK